MRNVILAMIVLMGGCSALTPGEVQRTVATLNQDMPVIRDAVARVTTNEKLIRDLDVIAHNISAMDTLLNK